MNYPETKKEDFHEIVHGREISDPYRWLEKDGSSEVQKWLVKQQAFTEKVLSNNTVAKAIKKRLDNIFRVDSHGVPWPKGGKYFYMVRSHKEDLHKLCVMDAPDGKPKVLVDPNTLSKDHSVTLSGWLPSKDGSLLAYELSEAGNDQTSIHVLCVKTGEKLADHIPAKWYPYVSVWDVDCSGFWYVRRDPEAPKGEDKFYKRIYFHKLGDPYENDVLVWGKDLRKEDIPVVDISADGRHLIVNVFVTSEKRRRTEIYILERKDKKYSSEKVFGVDAEAFGTTHRGRIYIETDYGAPRRRIISASLTEAGKSIDEWDEIIPESNDLLSNHALVGDKLFVEHLHDVYSQVSVYTLAGEKLKTIELPALGTLQGLGYDREGSELFFGFSSYVIPYSVYHYSLETDSYSLFVQNKVSFNFSNYIVEQKWFPSKDGTRVPMFLVHKKGLKLDGNNPTLVYGYGGFNLSTTPSYSPWVLPFIESGGVYVEVNLRGGGEFGKEWNDAGARQNKQTVFDDFIAAIEFLIKEKYTSSHKIGIFGWSNGGLLTAAVITQRPDLIKAAIIGAPVVDMLRFHLFHGGRHWIPEYGDPDKKEDAEYLIKYSPYHNVSKQEYPAVLMITADKDDRVHPGQAYKMGAMFQDQTQSKNPVLIRVEKKAGHSGARSTTKVIDRYGDILGFLFWQLGMESK